MAPVVILVPVLGRPGKVASFLEDAKAAAVDARVLFIATEGDRGELEALTRAKADFLVVPDPGTYPVKINAGYRVTTEPFLFLGADDLHFHPGWLPAAMAKMADGIGVVGTNDLYNPRVLQGRHSTHSLVRRSYIEEQSGVADNPDTVLHPGYRHWFCDDELVGTAQRRRVYAHAHASIVEHLHPYAGKAEMDPTYHLGESHRMRDQRLYRERRPLWR